MWKKAKLALFFLLAMLGIIAASAVSQPSFADSVDIVERESLSGEINQFLSRQLSAHLGAISTLDPPPARVLGAGTTGEFTWGTFMRSLGAYAELSGQYELSGRELATLAGQIGLLEHRLGGSKFSQLYAAQTLRHFGSDLKTNRLWQALSEQQRADWRDLVDPRKFYDPKTRNVINLPENYLCAAARLSAIDSSLGLPGSKLLDDLLDRAAHQRRRALRRCAPPTGRFDRH